MIELKGISKSYKSNVLNKININFDLGNIYVIKGISGSGKTTLLNIISMLDSDYTGEYLFDGRNIKKMNQKELQNIKKEISYVFQKSYLFKKLTARENLQFINDNDELINKYAKEFNVEKILDKKVETLSGGEKQRIALIRALISNSKILILDEPTSSLDKNNSKIFADHLAKLDISNKIIIISTHKDIYDDMATYIYNIQYGNISLSKSKEKVVNKENCESNFIINNNLKRDLLFVKRRKKRKIVLNIFLILFFVFVFFTIALFKNIKREIIKKTADRYPIQVIDIDNASLGSFPYKIIKRYDNYIIKNNEYKGVLLLDKNDSYFRNKDVFKCGNFSKRDNEVIINSTYLEKYFEGYSCSDILNKELVIENETFIISGILSDDYSLYMNNKAYRSIISDDDSFSPTVFIPYNSIKKIGKSTNDVIISIPLEDAVNLYIDDGNIPVNGINISLDLPWRSMVKDKTFTVYNLTILVIAIMVIILIFTFIFLVSKISLELYYKKKEIGFLRLYNISNTRIKRIYIISFFYEIIVAFILSVLIYYILSIAILKIFDMMFFIPIWLLIIITIMTFLYFYLLINIPLKKYLKMDILKCINK